MWQSAGLGESCGRLMMISIQLFSKVRDGISERTIVPWFNSVSTKSETLQCGSSIIQKVCDFVLRYLSSVFYQKGRGAMAASHSEVSPRCSELLVYF